MAAAVPQEIYNNLVSEILDGIDYQKQLDQFTRKRIERDISKLTSTADAISLEAMLALWNGDLELALGIFKDGQRDIGVSISGACNFVQSLYNSYNSKAACELAVSLAVEYKESHMIFAALSVCSNIHALHHSLHLVQIADLNQIRAMHPNELEIIMKRINTLKEYVNHLGLTPEQLALVVSSFTDFLDSKKIRCVGETCELIDGDLLDIRFLVDESIDIDVAETNIEIMEHLCENIDDPAIAYILPRVCKNEVKLSRSTMEVLIDEH